VLKPSERNLDKAGKVCGSLQQRGSRVRRQVEGREMSEYQREVDYAWAAGFFDGEGTVVYYVYVDKRSLGYALKIVNTDWEALEQFNEILPGATVSFPQTKRMTKQAALLVYNGERAYQVAVSLLRHSKGTKRAQLILFVEAREKSPPVTSFGRSSSSTSDKIDWSLRQSYHDRIKALKHADFSLPENQPC
jgi:hypothetical protein